MSTALQSFTIFILIFVAEILICLRGAENLSKDSLVEDYGLLQFYHNGTVDFETDSTPTESICKAQLVPASTGFYPAVASSASKIDPHV